MTIISAVILLGVLIFIHELGHFIVAKIMNVKILKFSLGFGPKLIGKKVGETEYVLSAIPLGGYVKMLGEEAGEELPEEEQERSFQFQSVSRRTLIVLAGPVFNIMLAYVIFTIFLSLHFPIKVPKLEYLMPVVKDVIKGSPAHDAGLRTGDRIIKIDGKEINIINEVADTVEKNPEKELNFIIQRGDSIIEYKIVPEELDIDIGDEKVAVHYVGVESYLSPVIGEVSYNSPAFLSGIKNGDKIIRIGGDHIMTWFDMVQVIQRNPHEKLNITVLRGNDTIELDVIPKPVEIEVNNKKKIVGRIGVGQKGVAETVTSETFLESLYKGGIATYKWGFFIFDSIKVLIKGDISSKNIAGPITIVRESGKAASAGLMAYLMFMALISVNLGILNLLPIPVLDGGHLMFFLFERIKGGPLNEKTVHMAQRIGFAFLIALMILAFYNDIMRIFVWK